MNLKMKGGRTGTGAGSLDRKASITGILIPQATGGKKGVPERIGARNT
jgi:hypothetical protein